MSSEQINALFQPFGQVHVGVQEGTGLGLYLAKVVVDAHGGTIRVESRGKDKGTTVTVEIPVKAGDDATSEGPRPFAERP